MGLEPWAGRVTSARALVPSSLALSKQPWGQIMMLRLERLRRRVSFEQVTWCAGPVQGRSRGSRSRGDKEAGLSQASGFLPSCTVRTLSPGPAAGHPLSEAVQNVPFFPESPCAPAQEDKEFWHLDPACNVVRPL